jgi:hypothetical protein
LGLKRKSNLEMSKMRRRRREGEELEENEEELAKCEEPLATEWLIIITLFVLVMFRSCL